MRFVICVTRAGNKCAGERVVNQTVLDSKLLVKQFNFMLEFLNLVQSSIQIQFFLDAVIVQFMLADCHFFASR